MAKKYQAREWKTRKTILVMVKCLNNRYTIRQPQEEEEQQQQQTKKRTAGFFFVA